MPDRQWVRWRARVEDWFAAVVLIAVVVAAVGGFVTYTAYEAPGTTTEQRQVSSWSANGTYDLTATVVEPNPLYPVGTELSDRPVYFLSASPVANATFGFRYRASEDGRVTVTARQTLLLRAVDSDASGSGSGPVEYWRIEEPLGSGSATRVTPGQPVRLTVERNVSRASRRMENVSKRLGGTPGTTQLLVVTTVTVRGQINGNDVSRTARYRLPIEVSGSTYRSGEQDGERLSGSTTKRVVRQQTYGPLWRIGGPLASALGVAAVLGLVYGWHGGHFAVSGARRDLLEFRSTREEFDEWITTARLPLAVFDRPRVEVGPLEGLVDTATDVDARAFETPEGDVFYVPDGELLYVYEPRRPGWTRPRRAKETRSTPTTPRRTRQTRRHRTTGSVCSTLTTADRRRTLARTVRGRRGHQPPRGQPWRCRPPRSRTAGRPREERPGDGVSPADPDRPVCRPGRGETPNQSTSGEAGVRRPRRARRRRRRAAWTPLVVGRPRPVDAGLDDAPGRRGREHQAAASRADQPRERGDDTDLGGRRAGPARHPRQSVDDAPCHP